MVSCKLSVHLACDPAVALIAYLPKRKERTCPHKASHMSGNSSFIFNAQNWRQSGHIAMSQWITNGGTSVVRNPAGQEGGGGVNLSVMMPSKRSQRKEVQTV